MGNAVAKIDAQQGMMADEEFRAICDHAPVNILYADRDLNIKYANRKSLDTLKGLAHLLPNASLPLIPRSPRWVCDKTHRKSSS